MVEDKEVLTVKEFKAWLVGLIRGKGGALPDMDDWKQIKVMLDKVKDEQPIQPITVPSSPSTPTEPWRLPYQPYQPWTSPYTYDRIDQWNWTSGTFTDNSGTFAEDVKGGGVKTLDSMELIGPGSAIDNTDTPQWWATTVSNDASDQVVVNLQYGLNLETPDSLVALFADWMEEPEKD